MQFFSSTEKFFANVETSQKKNEQFLVSKVEFNFEIFSGIKALPADPGFSS